MTAADEPVREDNGLTAASYLPLADVEPVVGRELLVALGRAGIAAYLEPLDEAPRHRLFVADGERADARSVVESAARAAGTELGSTAAPRPDEPGDTDSAFAALVADWHIDTVAAVRDAERDLTREDSDWRARLVPGTPAADGADEHYVPPAPPPLPRLAAATIRALLVIAASVALLMFGHMLGLDPDLTFLLGVAGVLLGAGLLLMRLREHPPADDDDGAVI